MIMKLHIKIHNASIIKYIQKDNKKYLIDYILIYFQKYIVNKINKEIKFNYI